MATYKNGISGTFSGKVGTVVGSSWNGIDYMRSLPRKSSRPPTERQKAQRLKLSLAISFLSPVSELVNVGFQNDAVQKSGFNVATSYLIQESITGVYPDFAIDYSKVLISSGNLTGAWNTTVSSEAPGTLTVSWTDNSGSGTAKSTDQAIILFTTRQEPVISTSWKGPAAVQEATLCPYRQISRVMRWMYGSASGLSTKPVSRRASMPARWWCRKTRGLVIS